MKEAHSTGVFGDLSQDVRSILLSYIPDEEADNLLSVDADTRDRDLTRSQVASIGSPR